MTTIIYKTQADDGSATVAEVAAASRKTKVATQLTSEVLQFPVAVLRQVLLSGMQHKAGRAKLANDPKIICQRQSHSGACAL